MRVVKKYKLVNCITFALIAHIFTYCYILKRLKSLYLLAERVGFEPTVPCDTHDFESCAFNRTRPSLLVQVIYYNRRLLFVKLHYRRLSLKNFCSTEAQSPVKIPQLTERRWLSLGSLTRS